MSYNQPGKVKQFVKAKPLVQPKEKPPYQRESKKNIRKYEQKTNQPAKDPREHVKILLNQFKPMQKNQSIFDLCKNFGRFFTPNMQKPQPEVQANFVQYLWFGNKKQPLTKQTKQISSDSSEPNWQSDQQKQLKLVSKKIDENVIAKVNNNKKQSSKKLDQLQRHEKQFLQDYYKQKRHILEQQKKIESQKTKLQIKTSKQEQKIPKKAVQQQKKDEEEDEWAQYDPNVGALITGGFIQKIQNGEDDEFDQDFSYESQKSKKSSSSEDEDDDMFADEGPRTITKTKQDKSQSQITKRQTSKEIVSISTHIFSQIAQQVGVHPETCVWIISNKIERYRVSTQYMNEYYKNSGLSTTFPYVSLNHSQFVSNEEIQTEKGLAKFKQFNERRRKNQNNYVKNKAKPTNTHYKQKK